MRSASSETKIDLFIGQFAEDENQKLPLGVSFAGNYYQKKIRSILSVGNSISIIYTDKNPTSESKDGIDYIFLKQGRHFLNIPVVIGYIIKLCLKGRQKDTVLFYNLSIYSLFFYIYYVLFTKARVVVILADAGFIIEKNVISRLLRRFLKYAYGILSLREIPELRKLKPKIEIMSGIVTNDVRPVKSHRTPGTVLLSGSLGLTTGLLLALDFFSSQQLLKLIITGIPFLMSEIEFRGLLEKYRCDSIKFLGALEYSEYVDVLQSVEFSLNLRNPDDHEHDYNFPSKILEYMSYGIIVVSSLRYPELPDDIYYHTKYSASGLHDCFEEILSSGSHERELLAKNASDFVKNNFSEDVLKSKISSLLM